MTRCRRAAALDHDAAPTGDLTGARGDRVQDRVREGETSPFFRSAGCHRKCSEIRNFVTWVTIKLFLHTQVS